MAERNPQKGDPGQERQGKGKENQQAREGQSGRPNQPNPPEQGRTGGGITERTGTSDQGTKTDDTNR